MDEKKARRVTDNLMSQRMFSGWGVRTLARGEGRYNPIGYHVGTVWPFDCSFIAWGLRRYGFKEEAAKVAWGILEASQFFRGRLPEAFGGYGREVTKFPVEYPTACSPQAWSTGAPLLFLRTMLGLEPVGEHLVVDRWGRIDAFGRGRVTGREPVRQSRGVKTGVTTRKRWQPKRAVTGAKGPRSMRLSKSGRSRMAHRLRSR